MCCNVIYGHKNLYSSYDYQPSSLNIHTHYCSHCISIKQNITILPLCALSTSVSLPSPSPPFTLSPTPSSPSIVKYSSWTFPYKMLISLLTTLTVHVLHTWTVQLIVRTHISHKCFLSLARENQLHGAELSWVCALFIFYIKPIKGGEVRRITLWHVKTGRLHKKKKKAVKNHPHSHHTSPAPIELSIFIKANAIQYKGWALNASWTTGVRPGWGLDD